MDIYGEILFSFFFKLGLPTTKNVKMPSIQANWIILIWMTDWCKLSVLLKPQVKHTFDKALFRKKDISLDLINLKCVSVDAI